MLFGAKQQRHWLLRAESAPEQAGRLWQGMETMVGLTVGKSRWRQPPTRDRQPPQPLSEIPAPPAPRFLHSRRTLPRGTPGRRDGPGGDRRSRSCSSPARRRRCSGGFWVPPARQPGGGPTPSRRARLVAGDPRRLLTPGPERLTGKHALHRKSGELADAQGEVQARGVVSSFQATESLVVRA